MTFNRKIPNFRGHFVSLERKFRGHLKKTRAKSPFFEGQGKPWLVSLDRHAYLNQIITISLDWHAYLNQIITSLNPQKETLMKIGNFKLLHVATCSFCLTETTCLSLVW